MARPKKFNADYFSHDADMRNDLRIKAIRTKFGLEGYAIYCMLLEVMTDHDYFQIDFTELEQELIAGDFGISAEKLNEVVDFIIRLDLFQMSETRLMCQKLSERLDSVLIKRRNASKVGVSVTETTQSKVKKKKEKKTFSEPTLQEVLEYAKSRESESGKAFYDFYDVADWVDTKGNKVINWKQKFITWQSRENTKPKVSKINDTDRWLQ